MSGEALRLANDNLGVALASFEMEISDAVLDSLLTSIAACSKDTPEESDAGLVLTALDAVSGYVNKFRSQADPVACGLIEELGMTYMQIVNGLEAKESRKKTAGVLAKIIQWQQTNIMQNQAIAPPAQTKETEQLPSVVLSVIEQHITETHNFVRQEIETLRSSVCTLQQNNSLRKTDIDRQISSAVEEQVQTIQHLLTEELAKLRSELQPAPKQA